jgi:hypothetical protein
MACDIRTLTQNPALLYSQTTSCPGKWSKSRRYTISNSVSRLLESGSRPGGRGGVSGLFCYISRTIRPGRRTDLSPGIADPVAAGDSDTSGRYLLLEMVRAYASSGLTRWRSAIRQCGAMRDISRDCSTKWKEEMVASQDLRLRAETGSKDSIRRVLASFAIAFALAGTATACAPIPCPTGYADPNWCNHFRVGGDG